jgi:sugar-specific transcriptional regulator TrmB
VEELLKKLGLSKLEARVYLFLIKSGATLAGTIAKKEVINRSNCYDVLTRLTEKGLVSFVIKENRKYFQATEPENLLSLLNQERASMEADFDSKQKEVEAAISKFKEISQFKNEEQISVVYESMRGIKAMLDDMIREKKEIVTLGVAGEISQILSFYLPRFHNERIRNKIPLKMILSSNLRKTRGKELEALKYTEVRYLPEQYYSMSTTNIYGDKTAILLWSENPIGILIKNKLIADSHRKKFRLLWDAAKV